MVDLAQLSQSNSYAQTSGPGFGTRMLCRPLDEHGNAPVNSSMWLTGLRRANALSMNTNDIPNSHMRSPGGFLEFFAGLTDPGDIQFEACWKNDIPSAATREEAEPAWDTATDYVANYKVSHDGFNWTAVDASTNETPSDSNSAHWTKGLAIGALIRGDFQRWQVPLEADVSLIIDDNQGFFHSMFYNRQPFEAWVIPPQWTKGLIVARGYAKMLGPLPHEMEGVINFQGAFKASGKPMLLRGTRLGGRPTTRVEITKAAVDDLGGVAIAPSANKRYRAVSRDLLTEVWSTVGAGAEWGEAASEQIWNIYEYTEDEGFGEAF